VIKYFHNLGQNREQNTQNSLFTAAPTWKDCTRRDHYAAIALSCLGKKQFLRGCYPFSAFGDSFAPQRHEPCSCMKDGIRLARGILVIKELHSDVKSEIYRFVDKKQSITTLTNYVVVKNNAKKPSSTSQIPNILQSCKAELTEYLLHTVSFYVHVNMLVPPHLLHFSEHGHFSISSILQFKKVNDGEITLRVTQ